MFFINENDQLRNEYSELLKIIGSLSRLSSESNDVYLYYRMAENIFCKAFNAENLSRDDSSLDAFKGDFGFGLKTFVHDNGKTYQKIAEFNSNAKDIESFKSITSKIKKVSYLRNERLKTTANAHNLDIENCIYHCVTREGNSFYISESKMEKIDIENISNVKKSNSTNNIITFYDGKNNYKYNISKSTLFKQFIIEKTNKIETKVFDDPFEILKQLQSDQASIINNNDENIDSIILPLYSDWYQKVCDASGLNAWNGYRTNKKTGVKKKRNPDEAYIPIPLNNKHIKETIHKFLPPKDQFFDLVLPDRKTILQARVTQDYGKALSTNPNNVIGKWLLRDVLDMPYGTKVTKDILKEKGIDSVEISKGDDGKYYINFKPYGSFDKFKSKIIENNL